MKKKLFFIAVAIFINLSQGQANASEIGQPAPQFNLPSLVKDKPVGLAQFKGKVIYLDFWASWCAPCRISFPLLNQLHQKLKAQGFEVIAINLDEDKANAEKFLSAFPVNFTVLRDSHGEWADRYVVESMPTSFIIDRQGIIQVIHHGFTSDDINELEQKIVTLLSKDK